METSPLSQQMLHYFTQLNDAEQRSIVRLMQAFINGRDEQQTAISIAAYNQELEEADAAIESGDFITHEEVMQRYQRP